MSKVQVMDHPLIQHKMSYIRDEKTSTKEVRELVDEVGMLMAYEVTGDLSLEDVAVDTPVQRTTANRLNGKQHGSVPILLAGRGMQERILKLIPSARLGHIGLYRHPETLEAIDYYAKFPVDIEEKHIFVTAAMLATGASAVE